MSNIEKIKICILGDICPTEDYRSIFDSQDAESLFGQCLSIMHDSDLSICNFECPATQNKTPIIKCGPNLRAESSDVAFLKNVGVDVCSLANNHIKDFEVSGVIDTIEACKISNMRYVGAGVNAEEARKPLILNVKNKKIGIISFAEEEFNLAYANEPGANYFDAYQSFDDIRELKKQSDYVIILYHGGIEHYKYPSPLLRKKCRKMIDSGADIVLCQHSHCIGTHENYMGGRILYGQGNSVFGYRKGNQAWNEGLIVSLEIDEDVQILYHLINATETGIILVKSHISSVRIGQMERESKNIVDDSFIEAEWKKYALSQKALALPLLYGKGRVLNKLNRILNNKIMNLLISKRKSMITMNLIRCEAHREVLQTILEDTVCN